jgi:hypothetical protein
MIKTKMTGLVAGGLVITIALGIRHDAVPEGHIEILTPAESMIIRAPAPYVTNVAAVISSGCFKP